MWRASTTVVLGSLVLAACASGGQRRFPLAPQMTRDQDLTSVTLPCRPSPTKKEPGHLACTPQTYVSPLAWDAIDNAIALPVTELLRLPPTIEAVNATAQDEVASSSWFEGRLGVRALTPDEVARGACVPAQVLDGATATKGEWVIDAGKGNGSSSGFRINVPGKGKYMMKVDDVLGERSSASSVIGAAVYHAVGFWSACEQIVYFDPAVLSLTPGLVTKDNSGVETPFDAHALAHVLERAHKRGNLLRMEASAWLPGRLIGPFRYEGTRPDDPNDVVPHEDRRELRGGRVLAAWTEHHDAREQNTMDTWLSDAGEKAPDASPGVVRHYYLDTNDCFGSEWEWEAVSKRLGKSYLLDVPDIALDLVSFGAVLRPWDTAKRAPGFPQFGFYDIESFVPDAWKNEYPNPAFSRMTERDAAWMSRILARIDPPMVTALVRAGNFTKATDAAHLVGVMQGRLEKIFQRYLTRLSPLGEVRLAGDSLCATDLARLRGVSPIETFRYTAVLTPRPEVPLALAVEAAGVVCATLPHNRALTEDLRDDAAARYVTLSLDNGRARGPLVVHLYDLGERGFYLAGIERPLRD